MTRLTNSSIDQWIRGSTDAINISSSEPVHSVPLLANVSSVLSQPPGYLTLVPTCLGLFIEHLYPIMPVIHAPTLRQIAERPLTLQEENLVFSLCAVTSTHMSGKSIPMPSLAVLAPSTTWELIGRWFLNRCISVRQSYDFVEDLSLSSIISSYFVSTAFFELNSSRKSWYYLREALTMAQDLGLHDETTYEGLGFAEALCRRRTFWLLYVTER